MTFPGRILRAKAGRRPGRWFVGGAADALYGCRPAPFGGPAASGRPDVRIGGVSNIHVSRAAEPGEGVRDNVNDLVFRHALARFRDQGADAVVVAGGLAENGVVEQFEAVAAAWEAVFPGLAPPGSSVSARPVGSFGAAGRPIGGRVPCAEAPRPRTRRRPARNPSSPTPATKGAPP